MLPELGTFSIILALCFSLLQTTVTVVSLKKQDNTIFAIGKTSVLGQFLFLIIAMLILICCFIMNDMTVLYVRDHSHTLLPLLYRIGAAWGGHEGSLLLWCLILAGWTLAFSLFSDPALTKQSYQQIIAILGLISTGFITFLLMTSNPFSRDFPTSPINGQDLTPILQDPGLIFHPPMLYMGYVGFAIAFAFAISALINGYSTKAWAKACRPWIILPWSFLSCGIVLGSWWAYRELGWGGWWFWDPVENASLLPWLSATALIHSLIVSEKRDTFKGWTLLLAIVTFTLSLLGTFLVRSGVLVSVHAFASDPTRGIFLLAYLSFIIGGALLLYTTRIHRFYQEPNFELLSKETFLLLNSIFLLACVATIVLGTLYPIILDALNMGKISVGEPYFNTVFLPIILPLLLLMGFAPHIQWKQDSFNNIACKLIAPLTMSLVLAYLLPYLFGYSFYLFTWLGLSLGLWIILSTLYYMIRIYRETKLIQLKHWSMIIAHTAIAVIAIGVTINKSYSEERQVKMIVGDNVTLASYEFSLIEMNKHRSDNYDSITAHFIVKHRDQFISNLYAEQRIYQSNQSSLSKPGVLFNPLRDLYVALGNSLPDGAWSVRIYYKPFVRWIWFGGFMLLASGLVSLINYFTHARRMP